MLRLQSILVMASAVALSLGLTADVSLAQKRQRDRITREEILASPHRDLDLYQVIRSLRPQFLEPRPGVRSLGGAYGAVPLAVYIDGVRETGVAALRSLLATRIEEVRYLDPTRSENEYGPRASGGALVVKLYKGAPPPRPAPAPPRDSTQPPRDSTQPPPPR
jgi:hypothetical protein